MLTAQSFSRSAVNFSHTLLMHACEGLLLKVRRVRGGGGGGGVFSFQWKNNNVNRTDMEYVSREMGRMGKWHSLLTKVPIGAGQAFTLAFLSKLLFNHDLLWQTRFGSGWTLTKHSTGGLHSPRSLRVRLAAWLEVPVYRTKVYKKKKPLTTLFVVTGHDQKAKSFVLGYHLNLQSSATDKVPTDTCRRTLKVCTSRMFHPEVRRSLLIGLVFRR